MEAVTEIFGKVVEFLKGVDWAKVFETVKGIVEKVVEIVSSLAD